MSRSRRLGWTIVALAIVAGGVSLAFQNAKQRAVAAAAKEEAGIRAAAKPAASALAPTSESIAGDAARSAEAWLARADRAVHARNARIYNAIVASLLDRPPDEAWPLLVDRALAGDLAAGAAALQLAMSCKSSVNPALDDYANGTRPNVGSSLYRTLPAHWQVFLGAIETKERERLRDFRAHCGGVGDATDFALLMVDRFFEPGDPDAELAFAETEENAAKAIADLRAVEATMHSAKAKLALGGRLLESRDSALQAEGRALLEALAPHHEEAVLALGRCRARGAMQSFSGGGPICHAFDGDADAQARWSEASAGLGDAGALMERIEALRQEGRLADAWGWSLYRLELALRGCLELGGPTHAFVGSAAANEEDIRRLLDPKQQNAGQTIANEIAGRWEAAATTRLDCAD